MPLSFKESQFLENVQKIEYKYFSWVSYLVESLR